MKIIKGDWNSYISDTIFLNEFRELDTMQQSETKNFGMESDTTIDIKNTLWIL